MHKRWIIAVLIAIALIAQFHADARPTWKMEPCFTLADVTDFLNRLPPDRALEAKVVAINSQRSFLGVASTPYYVWYRADGR